MRGPLLALCCLAAPALTPVALAPVARAQEQAPSATPSPAPSPEPEPPAPEVKAFLAEWAQAMRDVRTLRVRFKQTKRLRILKRPLVREGETLLKDGRVLMTVRGPDGQPETELLVVPGEARLHYPRLKRLEVFPLGEGRAPPTPFPLFGQDLEQLPRLYRLQLLREEQPKEREGQPAGEPLRTLVLVPRDEQAPLRETRMSFRGTTVVAVEQRNARGDAVRIEVSRFEKNPALEGELRLEPAPGTEVVRPVSGKD
ncbi:MAG: outer membrane lipoprotein carrier protein LolA [Planctomycetota bacterium]